MKRHGLRHVLMLLAVFCSSMTLAQPNAVNPKKGVLRVKLQPEMAARVEASPRSIAAGGVMTTGITPLDKAAKKIRAVQMRRVFPYVERFEAQRREFGLDRWYEIVFDEQINPLEAKQAYTGIPGVQVVENIVPMTLVGGNDNFTVLPEEQKNWMNNPLNRASEAPFNDPQLPAQWHYHNDGSMAGSVAGADINLFKAWELATGSKDVVIAIVDGGIDYTHVDLADNVYINQAELNGVKGQDDDNNGYIDDIYGYNFVTKSNEIYPHNHGTHVAGTVAAVNNNNIGVAGVAGGNGQGGVKMLSCQVFDSRSGAGEGDFAAALVYAAEMGASIAQCSWGWSAPGYYEQAVLDAIDYFTAHGGGDKLQGGLCIFAAGNEGATGDFYPGCYKNVLCVASMTYDKTIASYSNYGEWVDVAAPGGLLDYDTKQGVLSTLPGDNYGYNEGTSMACPHVSGIAALVLSKYGKADLLNETLRLQLLTSVHDIYETNPQYAGKLGSGYIDAYKALQMSDGQAPEPVADFTLYPAQDNIVVEWIVPGAADNNVNHHTIYYSTEEFSSESDLSKLRSVAVDTKFLSSGDKTTYELKDLNSHTTYYIALKSVDRWGNAAALSPVKSTTTNAGPKLEFDKSSLSVDIVATESAVGKAEFTISNKAEGLLKWTASARTMKVQPALEVNNGPNPGNLGTFSGNLSVVTSEKNTFVPADFRADEYPVEMKYSNGMNYAFIGESDMSLPNSEAIWFMVDPKKYPKGFNLTDVNISGKNGKEPQIQIYDGKGSITRSSLLKEVKYTKFAYGVDVPLDEQLYFAPGESFWVVVHFAAGSMNPLGMGLAETDSFEKNNLMSNDLGTTWIPLREALKGSKFEELGGRPVWNIVVKSKNPDWSEVLVLSPEKGSVKAQEQQTVSVANNGQKLVNGTYKFALRIQTNETGKPEHLIPATFTVKGYAPELVTAKVIDFGDLLVGQTKTLTVEVVNNGFGTFSGSKSSDALSGSNFACTSNQFQMPNYIDGGFPARAKSSVDITFSPTKAGSHTGTVVITDKDKRTYKFTVHGIAEDPAVIKVAPADIEAGELVVGNAPSVATFEIANEGSYPLEYVFPRFSDEKIEGMSKAAHKFGYSFVSNIRGAEDFEYDGNPALVNATDITGLFSDQVAWTEAIDLGFDFPYYNETFDKVYITSYGGIAMKPGRFCMVPNANSDCVGGLGFISAYGSSQLRMAPGSKVEYAKQNGKFIVKFTNVMAVVYEQDYTPVSFRIMLSPNGDVEIFYDDYTPEKVFEEGTTLFVGVNDFEVADPFTITDSNIADNPRFVEEEDWSEEGQRYKYIRTGTAIKILAPDSYFIQSLSSVSGIVNPGEKVQIKATLAAHADMYAGKTVNQLVILSNDPKKSTSYVNIHATVKGDMLQPAVELSTEKVDFKKVFRTSLAQYPLAVKNSGKDVLEVTSVLLEGKKVHMDLELPFQVEPGNSRDILLTLPTETEGKISDHITVVTSAGSVEADIQGEVIGVPAVTLSISEINETMASGSVLNKTLVVSNEGNEPLVYSIAPNEFIGIPVASADEHSSVSYLYDSSVDNAGIDSEWVDIETNGLGEQNNVTYYTKHDFVAVELPFEFPFYGKLYKKMYIYNTGFISFTERPDDKIWPEPPTALPSQETVYTNIIAPYWGVHSMDQTRMGGTFHYMTEDYAVVSFMEYGNSMNRGVCFQVILNRDGSFKFQYKGAYKDATIFNLFGVAGISNIDGTEGVNLPGRYVKFGEAVEFYPVKTEEIAAGAGSTIELNVLADKMAGMYESDLVLSTNIPGNESVKLPVRLNITGTPKAVMPDRIEGEWVTGTAVGAVSGGAEQAWELVNQGTAYYKVKNIQILDNPALPWGQPALMLMHYGEHEGFFPGEVVLGWAPYQEGTELTVGREPVKLAVALVDNVTVKDYEARLLLTVEGLGEQREVEIPVRFSITEAPVMQFDKKEIRIDNVAADYAGEAEMKLTNTGKYKLEYDIVLDPTGQGAPVEESVPARIAQLAAEDRQTLSSHLVQTGQTLRNGNQRKNNVYDLPENFEYNRSLYYPALPGDVTAYQYGAGNTYSVFKAATYFVAPEDGFNLSHIYMAASIGKLENVEIKFEVFKGETVDEGVVLGSGSIQIDKQENPQQGRFMVVALDKPVYLNPGEKFYVIATFPKGVEYPAYLCKKEEGYISNRYMGWQEGYGWFDTAALFKDKYGSLGYILTCLETEEGSPWVSMLTTETKGVLGVGESKSVKVRLSAATAPMDKENKAVLVIKSNDPTQGVVNYPIYLGKNVAPVVSVPASVPYVQENDTATLDIEIVDKEGESFMVELNDDSGVARLENFTQENGVGVATVSLTTDYEMAGARKFVIVAKDASNNTSSTVINYYVENVNRAPVAVGRGKIEVAKGQTTGMLPLSTLFVDPDGDEMTYEASMPENRFVYLYKDAASVVFSGLDFGQAELSVTATDAAGAKASCKFAVEVVKETGIDEQAVENRVSVYPNPVVDKAYVTCPVESASEISFKLYDASGTVVYAESATVSRGEVHAIDMENFTAGLYYLEIIREDEVTALPVMKK